MAVYSEFGIGTLVCRGRGFVKWHVRDQLENESDADAVEWFVLFCLPLIPLRCVHTFNWNGQAYQEIAIRWSWGLVATAFCLCFLASISIMLRDLQDAPTMPQNLPFFVGYGADSYNLPAMG